MQMPKSDNLRRRKPGAGVLRVDPRAADGSFSVYWSLFCSAHMFSLCGVAAAARSEDGLEEVDEIARKGCHGVGGVRAHDAGCPEAPALKSASQRKAQSASGGHRKMFRANRHTRSLTGLRCASGGRYGARSSCGAANAIREQTRVWRFWLRRGRWSKKGRFMFPLGGRSAGPSQTRRDGLRLRRRRFCPSAPVNSRSRPAMLRSRRIPVFSQTAFAWRQA